MCCFQVFRRLVLSRPGVEIVGIKFPNYSNLSKPKMHHE